MAWPAEQGFSVCSQIISVDLGKVGGEGGGAEGVKTKTHAHKGCESEKHSLISCTSLISQK